MARGHFSWLSVLIVPATQQLKINVYSFPWSVENGICHSWAGWFSLRFGKHRVHKSQPWPGDAREVNCRERKKTGSTHEWSAFKTDLLHGFPFRLFFSLLRGRNAQGAQDTENSQVSQDTENSEHTQSIPTLNVHKTVEHLCHYYDLLRSIRMINDIVLFCAFFSLLFQL